MKNVFKKFFLLLLVAGIFTAPVPLFAETAEYGNQTSDVWEGIAGSYHSFIQTLGTGLSGDLSQVDIETSNPAFYYYGSRPWFNLYECDGPEYSYPLSAYGVGSCRNVYGGLSETFSQLEKSTQSFYLTAPVTLNPSKYYFFWTQGNNQFNSLTHYYGSQNDTIEGQCYVFNIDSFYPCQNISDLTFRLYGVSKQSVPVCQSDCFDNVLFLPGLEASRLYVSDGSKETQLWEPNILTDISQLNMNTDGTSARTDVYTKDAIKTSNVPVNLSVIGQNIYKSFFEMMDSLAAAGTIKEWKAFPYDWRQNVFDVVEMPQKIGPNGETLPLKGLLEVLAKTSKSGKITIVAHSNGGLVAKALIKTLEDTNDPLLFKIGKLILVASPQLGTPSAVSAILHGFDQEILMGVLMTQPTARELGRNMPGAYGLLPSSQYFNHVSTPVVTFTPNLLDSYINNEINLFGQEISNYQNEEKFLVGADNRSDPGKYDTLRPVKLEQALLDEAEETHAKIDGMSMPSSIKIIQLAGWGLDTVAGFEYSAGEPCSYATDNGCTGKYLLDEKPIFTFQGDKTVVTPSALAMTGAENWWVNLPSYNFGLTIDREHKNIFEVSPILDFISNSLKGITNSNSAYITDTEPINTTNRLRLAVHSPVSLDAYDADGNHTGKRCPADADFCYLEENIPNSSYLEFGEGKYLNLPQEKAKSIKMVGIDTGTFTFQAEKVAPDGSSQTKSFVDIPVTIQTEAEITFNQNGEPWLSLDTTGDGKTDIVIEPSDSFDPVVYLQVIKTIVNSLDIGKGKINELNKKIDGIIAAIKKGKINKAKLKAEDFVKALEQNRSQKEKEIRENKIGRDEHGRKQLKKLSQTDAEMLVNMINKLIDNLN
jgi:pimeloyl-ACP methyl ester carboxylesterase